MSSRLIRTTNAAPAVCIGEKHRDADAEANAEKKLARLFPTVSLLTAPDGSRLMSVIEVHEMDKQLQEETKQAYDDGYKAGHATGLREGLAEAEKILSQFNEAIKNAIEQREALLNEARQHVLKMVVDIARRVTFDAIEADPEATITIINGVINRMVDRSRLKIRVHPEHLPVIEHAMDRFLKESTTIKELSFEADPRVQSGGCFIETPSGDVDARLESQFEVIRDTLQDEATGER